MVIRKHTFAMAALTASLILSTGPARSTEGTVVVFSEAEIKSILKHSSLKYARFIDATNKHCNENHATEFGKKLFFDPRLSRDEGGSCATCHIPELAWAGGDIAGKLSGTQTQARKTPSLTNIAYNRWFNWDGSADSLWAQCLGPIEKSGELDTSRVEIALKIQQHSDLKESYVRLFGSIPEIIAPGKLPASGRPLPENTEHPNHKNWLSLSETQRQEVNRLFVNVGKAIAAFEATLISDSAPFDVFTQGLKTNDPDKLSAISDSAKRGLKLFVGKAKCNLCHSGPNFTDSEFHNIFLGLETYHDLGRWDGIERLQDLEFNFDCPHNDAQPGAAIPWLSYVRRTVENKHQFKTPTLRNVMLHAPYMHTEQFETMEEVIEHYNNIDAKIDDDEHTEAALKSLNLSEQDKRDLVAFFETLTDEKFIQRSVSVQQLNIQSSFRQGVSSDEQ